MAKTILKRLGLLIVTLLLVTVLAFVAFSILPGDPTTAILGVDATDEQIAVLRERLGLQRQSCREEPRQQERKTDCVRFFYDFHFFLISRHRPANVNNALNIKSS